MKKTSLLSICFLCLLCLSAWGEVTPVDTIPFELGADSRLYVTVYINGQDDRPLRFLLDTGATDVVLNSNSPRTEGLAAFTGSVENSGANSVETIPSTAPSQVVRMGSRAISGLKLIAIPYPPDAWDGVLGLSYLRNFDVRIDYRRKSIFLYELGDGQKAASDKAVKLKMDYRLGVPVVLVGRSGYGFRPCVRPQYALCLSQRPVGHAETLCHLAHSRYGEGRRRTSERIFRLGIVGLVGVTPHPRSFFYRYDWSTSERSNGRCVGKQLPTAFQSAL